MWMHLARLPLVWRWLVKWILFGIVTLFTLFPRPDLLLAHIRHLGNVEALIQPNLPQIAEINRELDAGLKAGATRKEEFRAVEACVHRRIPYAYDWFNWGNLDYWPTTAEVLARQREDCDGRAVLATSLLRARGFQTARVVANLQHVWVAVDDAELMGPQRDANYRRVGNRAVLTFPRLRTVLASVAMMGKFPALRSLLILAAALLLAYHPCRNVTGMLAVSTGALVGFILLLDWGTRFDARAPTLTVWPLPVAVALLTAALLGALWANRMCRRRPSVSAQPAAAGD